MLECPRECNDALKNLKSDNAHNFTYDTTNFQAALEKLNDLKTIQPDGNGYPIVVTTPDLSRGHDFYFW